MVAEVINRDFGWLPLLKLFNVFNENACVQRVGMVEVANAFLVQGTLVDILVVGVVRQIGDNMLSNPL